MENLTRLSRGQRGCVAALEGDRRFLNRITGIGLTIGCPVELMRNEKGQPVLVYSRDTMIALNRQEGEKIMVEVQE
jgi:ferrous iron transport protein A